MTRITTSVLVMLILLNGSVSVISASGLQDDLGVELAPGVSESVDDTISELRKGFSPSAGAGQTLFTLFIAALGVLEIVLNGITAAPQMFINLGFPSWVVLPLFAPMYAISTLEMVYAATGRDLV